MGWSSKLLLLKALFTDKHRLILEVISSGRDAESWAPFQTTESKCHFILSRPPGDWYWNLRHGGLSSLSRFLEGGLRDERIRAVLLIRSRCWSFRWGVGTATVLPKGKDLIENNLCCQPCSEASTLLWRSRAPGGLWDACPVQRQGFQYQAGSMDAFFAYTGLAKKVIWVFP